MNIEIGEMKGILTEKNLALIKRIDIKQIPQHLERKRKRE